MDTTKQIATPRPWNVCNENQICGTTEYIADLAYSDLPEETVKANAKLIVIAVNSYDILVEAAEAALSLLDNIGTGKWVKTPAGDKLRAALSLLEE